MPSTVARTICGLLSFSPVAVLGNWNLEGQRSELTVP